MIDRKHFKTQANFDGFSKMHPKMQEVAEFAVNTALWLGVELPMITETRTTIELDKALGRVSQSHSEGRAFDFRTWNLTEAQLKKLVQELENKYDFIGAINKLGKKQLVVHHDVWLGTHLHIQLNKTFARLVLD
jgi:hypothetical protein